MGGSGGLRGGGGGGLGGSGGVIIVVDAMTADGGIAGGGGGVGGSGGGCESGVTADDDAPRLRRSCWRCAYEHTEPNLQFAPFLHICMRNTSG